MNRCGLASAANMRRVKGLGGRGQAAQAGLRTISREAGRRVPSRDLAARVRHACPWPSCAVIVHAVIAHVMHHHRREVVERLLLAGRQLGVEAPGGRRRRRPCARASRRCARACGRGAAAWSVPRRRRARRASVAHRGPSCPRAASSRRGRRPERRSWLGCSCRTVLRCSAMCARICGGIAQVVVVQPSAPPARRRWRRGLRQSCAVARPRAGRSRPRAPRRSGRERICECLLV